MAKNEFTLQKMSRKSKRRRSRQPQGAGEDIVQSGFGPPPITIRMPEEKHFDHLIDDAAKSTISTSEAPASTTQRCFDSDHAAALERLTTLERASREQAEETQYLTFQLHRTQEELEHYFLENKKLAARAQTSTRRGLTFLEAQAVRFSSASDQPPHLHLDFHVDGARFLGDSLGNLVFRLAEHHGRAGLVVFSSAGAKQPTLMWHGHGQENGRKFMLIFPQDEHGRRNLSQACARDIIFLHDVALLAEARLADAPTLRSGRQPEFWHNLASRLVAELNSATPDFSAGKVIVAPGDTPGSADFIVTPALAGGVRIPELRGRWDGVRFTLQRPRQGAPPLLYWPRKTDGRPEDSVCCWSFSHDDRRLVEKQIKVLCHRDREVIACLLRSLPRLLKADSSDATPHSRHLKLPSENSLIRAAETVSGCLGWKRLLAKLC